MSEYTAVSIKKLTRELIGKLAHAERRTLGEVVALAIEDRYRAFLEVVASKKAAGAKSQGCLVLFTAPAMQG